MRSIAFMSTASPVIFGMKSGLQPCIGCGLNDGCGFAGEPSGLRSCAMWLVSIGASAGSQTTILVSGRSLRSTRATPVERAAGAEAGDEVIELLALEVVDDLARGGALMHGGVGFVLELARQEPAMRLGELRPPC